MALDTLTTYNLYLKRAYEDLLVYAIEKGSAFSKWLDKHGGSNMTLGGQSLTNYWAADTELGWKGAALTEGGDHALPGSITARQFTAAATHQSYTLSYTGHLKASGTAKRFTYNARKLFDRLVKALQTEAYLTNCIFDMNDGTANLGQISSVSGTTNGVLTMKSSVNMNRFFQGMFITVRSATTAGTDRLGALADGEITDIDVEARTITIADADGALANDYVALYNFYDTTVPEGIRSLVGTTGTVQGANRATVGNRYARALAVSASSNALSEDYIQQLTDRQEQQAPEGEMDGNVFVGDHATRRWFWLLRKGDARHQDVTTAQTGIKTTEVYTAGGFRPFLADRFAEPLELYYLNGKDWCKGYPEGHAGGTWFDDDGSILHPATGSTASYKDAWEATWVIRKQNIIRNFRSQAKLTTFVAP